MAGIGFALRDLSRQETLSAIVRAGGHAALVAAGPWLFTIASLVAITAVAERVAGHETLATFRATIIYAFSISLVLSAPITIVATRLLADALWQRTHNTVRPLLVAALLSSVTAVGLGAIALSAAFGLPLPLALALTAAAAIVAMIWVAIAFCGAVKDYSSITWSFFIGLCLSVVAASATALAGLGAPGIVFGFTSGLCITLFGLTARILATFPESGATLASQFSALRAGFKTYAPLALGALLGAAGVWVDKWVFWFSPEGQTVTGGLIHAPLYDSAMFIASLVLIPALSQFVLKLETEFFDRYQTYYGTIQGHGTIDQIEAARVRLQGLSLESLTLITVAQLAVAAVLILMAPAIVEVLNLQFRQIAILRYGALGAVFQFIFIAATSMVVFFDRRRIYLALQALFFVLNLVLSVVTVGLGEDFYGVGYFAAALISAAVALLVAERTFEWLNYLTFIGNNPSIAGMKMRWWPRLSRALLRR